MSESNLTDSELERIHRAIYPTEPKDVLENLRFALDALQCAKRSIGTDPAFAASLMAAQFAVVELAPLAANALAATLALVAKVEAELATVIERWPANGDGTGQFAVWKVPGNERWMAGYTSFPTKRAAVYGYCGLPPEGGNR